MPKLIDLIGRRFGRLIVLDRADNVGRRTRWRCACDCGTVVCRDAVSLSSGRTKSCGCLKSELISGKNSGRWKGGRVIDSAGYVRIRRRRDKKRGYTCEHVLVMSEHIGRPLRKGESVHHKNGVRSDNRIENLELWVRPQPNGIRRDDAVKAALELLTQYAEDVCHDDAGIRHRHIESSKNLRQFG